VPWVEVRVINVDTNVVSETKTNGAGVYSVPNLNPGRYRILVTKEGFKQIDLRDVTLNVQDSVNRNFTIDVGGVSETVVVNAGDRININTTDASVSTVVDRQFAENLPLNGRSFQTLIQLTPGVVLTTSTLTDAGQFSVNGQRSASNYWMVDGVSANIGINPSNAPGNGFGGALGSFNVQGGTNSLVSVDAMQEFRIQTSTYAPEFGRTPGGQISIVTRSGTSQFHGTAFDYLRNDVLDASNWFNGYINNPPLPKARDRQNDFGGTFSGPILRERTFFFFSYEGLRLDVPQTALSSVPDTNVTVGGLNSRQSALPALQPYLNAYSLPNGPEVFVACSMVTDPTCPPGGEKATGAAQFNASYSDRSTLDAYSLRIDHRLKDRLNLFGRYNYSPSDLITRGGGVRALSEVTPTRITTQTGTVGAVWTVSSTVSNDLRFNYSRTGGSSYSYLDGFGGAVPLTSLPFPSPFTTQNASFSFNVYSGLQNGYLSNLGQIAHSLQRQVNLVDGLSIQEGSHSLKFGVDFRRLSPVYDAAEYSQDAYFTDVPSAGGGSLSFGVLTSRRTASLSFHNLGVYAQDTWRILPRLTMTYGLRWDVDFAPSTASGLNIPGVTGFDLSDLSNLALSPTVTQPYKTSYGNIAPRLGAAYQISGSQNWQTVLCGGFGAFFDLASQEVGNLISSENYPFAMISFPTAITFPFDSATAAPPSITPPSASGGGTLIAFDPHLDLPYALEWNVSLEQSVGSQQTISASYIGSAGRRLIKTADVFSPNPNYYAALLVSNSGTSDYDALQVQYVRRLSRGLQALASYTWAHSIDDGSAGSYGNGANNAVPGVSPVVNRGPSDFDIRNAFSVGATYDVPAVRANAVVNAVLRGWSLQNIVQARSGPPVDVSLASFAVNSNGVTDIRPDVVPGVPLYLYGPQFPGEKAFNPAAFTSPPTNSSGVPLRQGDLGRNALRGFGATQWDFAVHRDFPIRESLKLQFRAEMFNVLNHPNFAPPVGDFTSPSFGLSTQMLGSSLNQNVGGGGFSALYQIGGPRSIQFALKLQF
jgi:hypothetical protein